VVYHKYGLAFLERRDFFQIKMSCDILEDKAFPYCGGFLIYSACRELYNLLRVARFLDTCRLSTTYPVMLLLVYIYQDHVDLFDIFSQLVALLRIKKGLKSIQIAIV
jgi:hypothetical protein